MPGLMLPESGDVALPGDPNFLSCVGRRNPPRQSDGDRRSCTQARQATFVVDLPDIEIPVHLPTGIAIMLGGAFPWPVASTRGMDFAHRHTCNRVIIGRPRDRRLRRCRRGRGQGEEKEQFTHRKNYFPALAKHHSPLSVRKNNSPLDAASEALVGSPTEFVASNSYLGLARRTKTSPD